VTDLGYYELDQGMRLRRLDDPAMHAWMKKHVAIPQGFVTADAASVFYIDDAGRRWRLPKGDPAFDPLTGAGLARIDREVVTERDLFSCHGTFYELPAENAGSFAKIRPIASHRFRITDYCSYRGLLVLTGVKPHSQAAQANQHIVRSDDGKAALWVGVVDDLWKLGKPVGRGGPWNDTSVEADQPSDPYLMAGYDCKRLRLSHKSSRPVTMRVEVDLTGDGHWVVYRRFEVPPGQPIEHEFSPAFQAYWVRVVADQRCVATAQLSYE